MNALDEEVTIFTLYFEYAVVGWDLRTDLNVRPHPDDAIDQLIKVLGFEGLKNFIDYAMANEEHLDLIIADAYGTYKEISYDPCQSPKQSGCENDISITLLREQIEVCLNEFLELKRTKDEEAAKS